MSYNSVLDLFFSYWYINLGLMVVLVIAAFYLHLRKNKDVKFWFYCLSITLSSIWAITYFELNPIFLGFGNPCGVDGIVSAGGKLYVVDYLITSGSKYSDPEACSRIHVLDAKTGNKILRFPTHDHGELNGVKGDSLIFHFYYDTGIFSASTGKLIAKWNNETLPKIFPELASGIDNVMINRSNAILELTTLDGNHFNLSLKTGELWADKPNETREKYSPTNQIYLNNDDEIKIDNQPGGRTLLELQGIGNSQEIRYLKTDDDSVANENLKFIMGKFIAISPKQRCFVVISFETTKETGFILTGVSLDGKNKLWELTQTSLRPEDKRDFSLPTAWTLDNKTDILYFAMKDEVIALEILSGKILWRQKL